jgi:hypothetical protein
MFAEARLDLLRQFVPLRGGAPSHDAFSRMFAALDPEAFAGAVPRFMSAFGTQARGDLHGRVAIDGKSLRRAYHKGQAHMPPLVVTVFRSARPSIIFGSLVRVEISNPTLPKTVDDHLPPARRPATPLARYGAIGGRASRAAPLPSQLHHGPGHDPAKCHWARGCLCRSIVARLARPSQRRPPLPISRSASLQAGVVAQAADLGPGGVVVGR